MHFINWGQESPQQAAERRRAELEWQALVEQAINVKMRQQGQAAPAPGGGSKPTSPVLTGDAGAVLYLDGTWKYLFLDYPNGVISEAVDTGVSADYKYYVKEICGPIQDRGCVYALATSPAFNAPNDYALIYISTTGELVEVKEFSVDLSSDFGGGISVVDGLAHVYVQLNSETLASTVSIFNGNQLHELDFPVKPGYVANLIAYGTPQDQTLGGNCVLYSLNVGDLEFTKVDADLWLVNPETGTKRILASVQNIFNLGNPTILFQTKGSLLYFCLADGEDNLTRVQAYSLEGTKLFDVDLTATALDELSKQSILFYGTDCLQIVNEYSDGVDTGWVLHNFNGLTNSYSTKIVALGEYTNLEKSYCSTYDPYSVHSWSEANGILNVFYTETGSPMPALFTPVSKAKAVWHLGGETSYREVDIKTETSPELSLFLTSEASVRIVGKSLVLLTAANDNISALTFGSSIYSTDLSVSTDLLLGWYIVAGGDNAGIQLVNDIPGEKKINIVLDPEGTVLADVRGDFQAGAGSFGTAALGGSGVPPVYFNQTTTDFQELPTLSKPDIKATAYGSSLMRQDGNILITNGLDKPAIITSTQVIQSNNIDYNIGTNLLLGKSMLLNSKYNAMEGSYLKTLAFDGTVLQYFTENTDQPLDYVRVYGDRGLGIRYNDHSPGGTDIVLVGRNGIDEVTLVGPAEWEIIPMLNDVVWFYDYAQPEVSYFSIKVNTYAGNGVPQFTIPTAGGGYNYTVYWNSVYNSNLSGKMEDCTGDCTIGFPENSEYIIKIYGDFPRIFFDGVGDCQKLSEVLSWGTGAWTSMQAALKGCSNLVYISSQDSPNLSQVTDMSEMFSGALIFNDANIDNWDVSSVTDMSFMFAGALAFNKNLNNWNTANVATMQGMFNGAIAFNGDISNWNTANVVNMSAMFYNASLFNFNITNWNTGNVTDMSYMFSGATSFSQSIGSWNTGSVATMHGMFAGADNFDANLMTWNTANVTDMSSMFNGATTFGSNLASLTWNTGNVTNMSDMFNNAVNFRGVGLHAWNTANVTNMKGMFNAASLFDQDLSSWCVTLIPSAPADFDSGAASWMLPRPVWGTCPA